MKALLNIAISFVPIETKVVHEVYCDRCQSKMHPVSATKFKCLTCSQIFVQNPDEESEMII
ncbi:MAG TPA: hypothetical protein VI894_02130 [Candidatus Nanoarchaeia archaeon]|nr:hypothetical protein [Candidatus Nanoarchaeia archaeon]